MPIIRAGGCASFTKNRNIANRFSGKNKRNIGIVVQLLEQPAQTYKVILAPPSKTKKWFNNLYKAIIGESFRFNEEEYVICADKLRVKVIDVKQ